jgi:hypothetical protein
VSATGRPNRPASRVHLRLLQKSPYILSELIITAKHCHPRLTLCTKHPAKCYLRDEVVHDDLGYRLSAAYNDDPARDGTVPVGTPQPRRLPKDQIGAPKKPMRAHGPTRKCWRRRRNALCCTTDPSADDGEFTWRLDCSDRPTHSWKSSGGGIASRAHRGYRCRDG